MGEPEKICDRVGVIFAGRLVKVGTPNELKHSVSELSTVEVETPGLAQAQVNKIRNLGRSATSPMWIRCFTKLHVSKMMI